MAKLAPKILSATGLLAAVLLAGGAAAEDGRDKGERATALAVVGVDPDRSFHIPFFGSVDLMGLGVEPGDEMTRIRGLLAKIREWEFTSSLVAVGSGGEAHKFLIALKAGPSFRIAPIYSPNTVFWAPFGGGGERRMVMEDLGTRSLRIVIPPRDEKLPTGGFWIVSDKKDGGGLPGGQLSPARQE